MALGPRAALLSRAWLPTPLVKLRRRQRWSSGFDDLPACPPPAGQDRHPARRRFPVLLARRESSPQNQEPALSFCPLAPAAADLGSRPITAWVLLVAGAIIVAQGGRGGKFRIAPTADGSPFPRRQVARRILGRPVRDAAKVFASGAKKWYTLCMSYKFTAEGTRRDLQWQNHLMRSWLSTMPSGAT
jgi:hypothetical protein